MIYCTVFGCEKLYKLIVFKFENKILKLTAGPARSQGFSGGGHAGAFKFFNQKCSALL